MVGSISFPAFAQYTRDNSANLKIDEAINDHYLMMDLDKSEKLLIAVVGACEDKCTNQTKAKAWMYVGIVRGSGKDDQAGAAEAFKEAKTFDPAVQLDEGLASSATKKTFASVVGSTPPAPTPPPAAVVPSTPGAAGDDLPGDMICTPTADQRTVQTRTPIPVSCTSDADVASAEIRFKEADSTQWKKMPMTKVGEFFQAELPCDLTETAGPLSWFIAAKDSTGEYVDQYGSRSQSATFEVSEYFQGAAPAFPGQAPVTRCPESGAVVATSTDCPPNFPGCATTPQQCGELEWGASCTSSSQCQCGLLCNSGSCENAPTCSSNADCDSGSCVNGYCAADPNDRSNEPYAKHWLSFDIGFDLVSVGGNNLCGAHRETGYGSQCFDSAGERYIHGNNAAGNPLPDAPGVAGSGLAPGQLRLKVGYDFAFSRHFSVGARVGFGFLNTRPDFLPVSAEARITYHITALSDSGFRPYLYAGGGLGEVNGMVQSRGYNIYRFNDPPVMIVPGAGFVVALQPNLGLKFDVGAVITVGPSPGFGVLPSIGFVYGL